MNGENCVRRRKAVKEKLIGILHRLFRIYSPRGGESEISGYASNFLDCCGFKTERDSQNNLLASRGVSRKLPLLHAHFDTIQDGKDMGCLLEMGYDREKGIFHMDGVHIGCDDKAGIAIILYLAMYSNLEFKALFTVREKGRSGIRSTEKGFLSDACWAFSLDAVGKKTIITKYKNRETCDECFIDEILTIGNDGGALFQEGQSRLDYAAYYISEYVPNTVGIPVGFYNSHNKNDYLNVCDAYKALEFVKRCIESKNKLITRDTSPMGIFAV